VGEVRKSSYGGYPVIAWDKGYIAIIGDKFYTTPPKRPWVGLTDEEVHEICNSYYYGDRELVKLIETKLKEKNNAL
jgi:hypothetical protein